MHRRPSSRRVTIPSSIAFCRSTTVGARWLINSRIGSVMSQQFVNAFAAFVAGVVARVAPFAVIEILVADLVRRKAELGQHGLVRFVRRAAIRCKSCGSTAAPSTASSDDGNHERLHAHVDQARDSAGRVVRVQRGKNQVARERCLDRDLRRLQIARFTHHDAVRILPQKRAQHAREIQADRLR